MSTNPEPTPVFVVFEGLDGSGKSTCARKLAEALDGELMTTPSPAVRRFQEDLVASYGGCQEAAQLFYLSTVFDASARIAKLLDAGRSVVLDRYLLSTLAYGELRGSSLDLDEMAARILPAHLTVFLEVPLAVRRARIATRGASAGDRETMRPEADERLRRAYARRFGLRVVGRLLRLDGHRLGPDEVVARVLEALGRAPLRAAS